MNIGIIGIATGTAILMFSSGLQFDPALFRTQMGRQGLRALAPLFLGNYLLIPALTLALISCMPFSPSLNLVLMTLALLPCAPLVPPLASLAGASGSRMLFVFLAMSLLNLAMIPLLLFVIALPWVGGQHMQLGESTVSAVIRYVASIYGPMALGAALRVLAPRHYPACAAFLQRLMPPLMLVVTALFIYSYREALIALRFGDLLALLLFESICVLVALLVVLFATTREPHDRIVSVLTCTLRNFAMGAAFTAIVFPHTAATTYMLVFTCICLAIPMLWVNTRRITDARGQSKEISNNNI